MKTLLLISLFFLFSNICSATTYVGCSAIERNKIDLSIERAIEYSTRVILSGNSEAFTRWMGFNEINDVKETFFRINSALKSNKLDFTCGCPEEIFGLSLTDTNYKMILCAKFFNARLDGWDSRAGTLIHELSHFDTIASTHDFVIERSECLRAATLKDTQSTVLENANSYEYLAEDINGAFRKTRYHQSGWSPNSPSRSSK